MIMDLRIIKDILPHSGVCGYEDIACSLLPCRAVSRLPQGAKSVIVSIFPYYLGKAAYSGLNISKYAAVPDYHTVVAARLERACAALQSEYPDEKFAAFTDNSPLPEVYAAYLAGLGVIGKNGLLITPDFGSYVFIGEIVTTLALKASSPAEGGCSACGKCTARCPAGALNGGFYKEKCLSAITQKKSTLTSEEERLIRLNACAWGCDECQNACPMNAHAAVTDIEEFIAGARPCVNAGDSVQGRAYAWRGKDIIERNLALLQTDGKE